MLNILRYPSKVIPLIPFILPINVFLIGDFFGAGLQFPLIRIQETHLGWSIIFIWREFWYVANGVITGRSAFSIHLWIGGVLLLVTAAVLLNSNRGHETRGVTVYGLACALLMGSTIVQYGPLFSGPAGVCVPIGLPLLVVIGYILWKDAADTGTTDESDDDLAEAGDAAPLPASAGADASADD